LIQIVSVFQIGTKEGPYRIPSHKDQFLLTPPQKKRPILELSLLKVEEFSS
jgi:hypothetical protein